MEGTVRVARFFCVVLGILLALFAGGFFVSRSQAAGPVQIKALSPMPLSAHVQGTDIVFEIEITDGNRAQPFQISWDFNYGGAAEPYDTTTPQIPAGTFPSLPARIIDNPGHPEYKKLRAVAPGTSFSGADREFEYRIKVRNGPIVGGTEVIIYGTVFVAEDLQFSGYTWFGASTPVCVGGPTPGSTCLNDGECGLGGKCGNDAVGWSSFSCVNENLVCASAPTYLVKAEKSAGHPDIRLTGNTWLGTEDPVTGNGLGWMTFEKGLCVGGNEPGTSCAVSADCDATPPGSAICSLTDNDVLTQLPDIDAEHWSADGEYTRLYDRYDAAVSRFPTQLAGWGRLLTIRDQGETYGQQDWGWVHLRGAAYTPLPTDNFLECVDCTAGFEKCNICNAVNTGGGTKNYSCNSCYNCDASGSCAICQKCSQYGVSFDTQRAQLTGFAWAGSSSQQGLGWVQFNPPGFGGVSLIQAWLATRFGDIFVGGNVSVNTPLPAPLGSYNATYVIQANGSVEFVSRAGLTQPSYPSQIGIPSVERQYINVLGRLDFTEMTREGSNRYGQTILPGVSGDQLDNYLDTLLADGVLDGKIYYHVGDVTIDNSMQLNTGTVAHPNGSGTVIIDGDLTITGDATKITYAGGAVDTLLHLPSIAWLVRGDIIVDPSVGSVPILAATDPDLVGAFFALGCPAGSGLPCEPHSGGSQGEVHTGDTDIKELVVNGLMMAKTFFFERTVLSGRGSEQILYDGRFIANPPPGLQNLSAALPVIREVTP